MQKSVVILRTHLYETDVIDHFRTAALRAGHEFVVAVDSRAQEKLRNSGHNFVAVGHESFRKLGLFTTGADELWKCGDYWLYVLHNALPCYKNYWLVERDVYMNFTAPFNFFSFFDRTEADLLAPGLALANEDWFWLKATQWWFADVWRCCFPVLRLSNRAIVHLYQERVRQSEIVQRELRHTDSVFRALEDNGYWPNDEGFVASSLQQHKFSCVDINWPGHPLYTKETLTYNKFYLKENMNSLPVNKICHSVVSRAEFVQKMAEMPVRMLHENRALISQIRSELMPSDPDFSILEPLLKGGLAI